MTTNKLDAADAAVAKLALRLGYYQHIIAGYFMTNQGRISELKNGKWGGDVTASDYLPPDFPALA